MTSTSRGSFGKEGSFVHEQPDDVRKVNQEGSLEVKEEEVKSRQVDAGRGETPAVCPLPSRNLRLNLTFYCQSESEFGSSTKLLA